MKNIKTAGVLLIAAWLSACAQQPIAPPQAAQPAQPAASAPKAAAPTAAVMTKAVQSAMTPDQALQRLKDGNARFVSGAMEKRNLPAQVKATGIDGQFPFASIVSCIDSRAAPAHVFDLGVGDAFSASVAGNVVNPDILGSLEFASKVAGAKVIVILGHTHCGAVKGACDNAKLGNLTQLVGKIRPAVNATPSPHGADRSSKNHHFVDEVAHTNVKLQVKQLLAKSPVLREMAAKGEIKVVGAMLDVETGKVQFE